MAKQRVLIVDDSPLIRRMLKDWIGKEFDLECVGEAEDGNQGVALAKELKPDVITMDVEMPNCNGIDALAQIMKVAPTPVLMVSSVTTKGASYTLKALELGAYDFVTKPGGSSSYQFCSSREEVLNKIRAARYVNLAKQAVANQAAKVPTKVASSVKSSDKVVLLAASTGGPPAILQLWQSLPNLLPAPILIVQHMPAGFTEPFAKRITKAGTVPCVEAKDGMALEPGVAILAPGGMHMIIDSSQRIRLDDSPTLHGVKPAADFLFESAAKVFGNRIVAAVLTGMGRDAAAGALHVKKAGGVVYGQNAETCAVYGMPKAALDAGAIHSEWPIGELANVLVKAIEGKRMEGNSNVAA